MFEMTIDLSNHGETYSIGFYETCTRVQLILHKT